MPIVRGVSDPVEQSDAANKKYVDSRASGKNLFLNWDFRRPVNRNGQAEYTGLGYTIDRWKLFGTTRLELLDNCVHLTATATNNGKLLGQIIENPDFYAGKTVTLSALLRGNVSASIGAWDEFLSHTFYGSAVGGISDTPTPLTHTFTFPDDLPDGLLFSAGIENDRSINIDTAYVDIFAVKLELGDHQTLARQNEDGEWEIIDPPDYDLQYLLCSQYSPSTGEWVGSQHSNTNLLDNAYWANKASIINQRGQTEYTGAGYTIDRWYRRADVAAMDAKTIVLSDGIKLTSDTSDTYCDFTQRLEDYTQLLGRVVTISFLIKEMSEGNIIRLALYASNSVGTNTLTLINVNATMPGLYTATGQIPEDIASYSGINLAIRPWFPENGGEVNIKATKLEFGPIQTLAHKEGDTWVLNDPPPNKALELLKCQRYQLPLLDRPGNYGGVIGYGFIANATDARICIPTPTTMRATPTMSFLSGGIQNLAIYDAGGSHAVTSITPMGNYNNQAYFLVQSSGLAVNSVCILRVTTIAMPILDCNL